MTTRITKGRRWRRYLNDNVLPFVKGASAGPSTSVRKLLAMLAYKRPAGSVSERLFVQRYLTPLGATVDGGGNHWLAVPGKNGEGLGRLFSSHIDTVHRTPGMQEVVYDHAKRVVTVRGTECLGADCGVGVWLMREMVLANVPGIYVFHACEERGGKGSAWVAKHTPEKLAGVRWALAFDRAGCEDIITHQWRGRTASDAFASGLAEVLKPLKYLKSDGGSFTDTANYCELVGECSNIGVGYERQHTSGEWLDVGHAVALRGVLCGADWSGVVVEREPGVPVREWGSGRSGGRYGYYGGGYGARSSGGSEGAAGGASGGGSGGAGVWDGQDGWEGWLEDYLALKDRRMAKHLPDTTLAVGSAVVSNAAGTALVAVDSAARESMENYVLREYALVAGFLAANGFGVADVRKWALGEWGW